MNILLTHGTVVSLKFLAMAIIENEILREARGRLGDFIIYQYRGKTCLRQRPARKTKQFSPGQLAQQERISSVAVLYQAAKSIGSVSYTHLSYPVRKLKHLQPLLRKG